VLVSITEHSGEDGIQPRHRRSIQRPMQTVRNENTKPRPKPDTLSELSEDSHSKSTPYLTQQYPKRGLRRVSAAHISKHMDRDKEKNKTSLSTPSKQVSLAIPVHTSLSTPAASNPNKVLLRSVSSSQKPIIKSAQVAPRKNPVSPKSPKSPTSPSKKQGKHLSEKGEAEMDAIMAMLAAEV